jgi:uncharacterized membrane protein YgaE (UPF0421/DUF939 family)
MQEQTQKISISNVDVRIGIGTVLGLLVAHFFDGVQALAVCTAIIMCTQDNSKFSWKSGLNRVLGVVIGGLCGTVVVLLDTAIGNEYVFILLAGLGVVLNLVCCQLAKMPNIVARVSCITFVLVVLLADGLFRVKYALLRLLGTVIGALLALVLAWAWDQIQAKLPQKAEESPKA